jgi:acyl dehydratase
MATRTLHKPPAMAALYARTAAAMIPGASLLPFVPGRGEEMPDVELTLARVRVDPAKLAAYAEVCGFTVPAQLPPTYPHVLAFPLQMAAMTDGRFPFAAVGLVHVENRIVQHRPIAPAEELEIRVRASGPQPHPRGRTFALVSEVHAAGELVWEGRSTMLSRGGGTPGPAPEAAQHGSAEAAQDPADAARDSADTAVGSVDAVADAAGVEWSLGGDLGRRYAAVSGDRNPIHMHPLAARALGFPRAIAHGMWTKARCLAALEDRLGETFSVEVRFQKPILLPARVRFASAARDSRIDFAVTDPRRERTHLEGGVRTLGDEGRTA